MSSRGPGTPHAERKPFELEIVCDSRILRLYADDQELCDRWLATLKKRTGPLPRHVEQPSPERVTAPVPPEPCAEPLTLAGVWWFTRGSGLQGRGAALNLP